MTGTELNAAIQAIGITQTELANYIGMSREHLSRCCTGVRPVSRMLALLVTEWQGPAPVTRPGLSGYSSVTTKTP